MPALPEGFSLQPPEVAPAPKEVPLPEGFTIEPPKASKAEQEYKREPVPAELSEDPFERAALRTRRTVSTPRDPNAPLAKLPEKAVEAYKSADKTAEGLLKGTIEPTPENVLPAVTATITPVARGAAAATKAAAEALPRFTESAVGQRAAERLGGMPYVGKPIREATDKALGQFEERALAAPSKATGSAANPAKAGRYVQEAIKDEEKFMTPKGTILEYGETRKSLPDALAKIAKGRPDNAADHLLMLAERGENIDLAAIAQIRPNLVPHQWREIQGASLEHLGQVKSGPANPVMFDPGVMLNRYESMSEGGKNVLFGTVKKSDLRRHLDSLLEDSKRMEALRRIPERPTAVGYTKAAGLAGWAMAEPVSALTTVIGARMVANILAKPHSTAALAEWSKAYVKFFQSGGAPGAIAALKIATNNLKNNADVDIDSEKLVEAMRGPKGQRGSSSVGPASNTDSLFEQMNIELGWLGKIAPKGIPWESMRRSENVEHRPKLSLRDEAARYWEPPPNETPERKAEYQRFKRERVEAELAASRDYQNNYVPNLQPGRLGQEAGLADLERPTPKSRFNVQEGGDAYRPPLPPLPKHKPRKEAKR